MSKGGKLRGYSQKKLSSQEENFYLLRKRSVACTNCNKSTKDYRTRKGWVTISSDANTGARLIKINKTITHVEKIGKNELYVLTERIDFCSIICLIRYLKKVQNNG